MFEIDSNLTVGLTRDSTGRLGLYGFNHMTGETMEGDWFKERNLMVSPKAKITIQKNEGEAFGCK